ncbi:MAG: Hsp33 family molecular chaperone HslO [Sinobacterium sp.]|nr:Hsp33 family molecular chaperone HslO [Sinobacterium sp.]
MTDQLLGFMFEKTDILGAIVELDASFLQLVEHHDYPDAYKALMSQFVAANVLLTSKLKFEGSISLQARGAQENVSLALSECTEKLSFRGILRGGFQCDGLVLPSFSEMFAGGALALTVEPAQGQRYQGVVPLEKDDLAGCLQDYYDRSEQIPTWFYLVPDANAVRGIMLQALPAQVCESVEQRQEDWLRIVHLASTIKPVELLNLPSEEILYRLFNEESVRVFDPKAVSYDCSCSRERMERALIGLGRAELEDILVEQGKLETQCEFCMANYCFDEGEIRDLIQSSQSGH